MRLHRTACCLSTVLLLTGICMPASTSAEQPASTETAQAVQHRAGGAESTRNAEHHARQIKHASFFGDTTPDAAAPQSLETERMVTEASELDQTADMDPGPGGIANVAGLQQTPGCAVVGNVDLEFPGNNVLIGTAFTMTETVNLYKFGFAMDDITANPVNVNLYFSIHRRTAGETGTFIKVYGQSFLRTSGSDVTLLSTDNFPAPLEIEEGYEYIFTVAWTTPSMTYTNDPDLNGSSGQAFPEFPFGTYLGVTVQVNPMIPTPDELPLFIGTTQSPFVVQLCLTGACCLDDDTCEDLGRNECVAMDGDSATPGSRCDDPDVGMCPFRLAACCNNGVCDVQTRFECDEAGGTWFGDGPEPVFTCSDEPDLCIPKGACCADAGICVNGVTEADCIADDGFYNGDDTSCEDLETGCNRGACCLLTGNCVQRRLGQQPGECNPLIGHTFHGYGSTCQTDTCASRGACCLGDICLDGTPEECENFGGNYRGDNTECENLTIPCGSGACCRASGCEDGDGTGVSADACFLDLNGLFQGDGTTCGNIDPCPGLCCEDNDDCLVTDAVTCNAVGVYAGFQDECDPFSTTVCEDLRNEQDVVACCLPNGNCVEAFEDTCTDLGGAANSEPTCAAAMCDESDLTGGCCLINGSCQPRTEMQCDLLSGIFRGIGVACPGPDDSACERNTCCLSTGGALVIPVGLGSNTTDCVTEEICDDFGGQFQPDCDAGVCESSGACCLPDDSCLEVTAVDCGTAGGFYRGDGIDCDDVPSCTRGACCDSMAGTCTDTLGEDCMGMDQLYLGDDSDCMDGTACEIGACCMPDESCNEITRGECSLITDGSFAGADSTCDEGTCDIGACCHADGTCDDAFYDFECSAPLDAHFPATCAQIQTLCEPRGICCANGTCSDLNQDDCTALGGMPGPAGSICADYMENPCDVGSCCVESTCTDDMTRIECDAMGGAFRMGVTCDTPCPEDGACCMLDGSCIDKNFSSIQCNDMEGDWSPGSTCELVGGFCNARGACCLQDDSCQLFTEAVCVIANGEYNGDGVGCSDVSCIPPMGACCLPDESCAIQTEEDCGLAGGYYNGDESDCVSAECEFGACCDGESCSQTIAASCSGTFVGAGVDCSDTICNSGACCEISGCTETLSGQCTGLFRDGYTCDAETCATGSCCELDGDCRNNVFRDECPALTEPDIDPFHEGMVCNDVICDTYGTCCLDLGEGMTECTFVSDDECSSMGGVFGAPGLTCEDDIGGAPCEVGVCCLANGMCDPFGDLGGDNIMTRVECFRRGGSFQQEESCSGLSCPDTGACCEPDGGCSENLYEEQCVVNLNGVYAGNGTDCDTTFQVCETASCCEVDGTCSDDVLGAECYRRGGDPIDSAQTCMDDPACNPRGACCLADESCTLTTEMDCVDTLGGSFAGVGTLCDNITCTEGGCCFGETCELRANEAACIMEGGCFSDSETCDDVDCLSVVCLTIDDSIPTSGYIDRAQNSEPDGSQPAGLASVTLMMTADTSLLTTASFGISSTSGSAPAVASVIPNGNDIEVLLDGPIPAGAWTTITFLGDGSAVCLGFHPGNVDGKDPMTNGGDIRALIGALDGNIVISLEDQDVNRDGEAGPEDILRTIDLLNGGDTYVEWFGLSLPPNPCIGE